VNIQKNSLMTSIYYINFYLLFKKFLQLPYFGPFGGITGILRIFMREYNSRGRVNIERNVSYTNRKDNTS